jgi:hypothetical protein
VPFREKGAPLDEAEDPAGGSVNRVAGGSPRLRCYLATKPTALEAPTGSWILPMLALEKPPTNSG